MNLIEGFMHVQKSTTYYVIGLCINIKVGLLEVVLTLLSRDI